MAENMRYKDDEVYEPLPEEVVPVMMSEDKIKKDVPGGLKKGTNDDEEPEPIGEEPEAEETQEELEEQRISEILGNVEEHVWPEGDVPDKESDVYLTGVYIYLLNNTFNAYEMCLSEEDIQRAQGIIEKQMNPLFGASAEWQYMLDGGGYGWRDIGRGNEWHAGLDLYTNGEPRLGAPLYSAWEGTVIECEQYSNEFGSRGNVVLIELDPEKYGEDVYILFEHLGTFQGDVIAKPGARVFPGSLLGTVGNTGDDNGKGHVHIEIMIGGITETSREPDSETYYSIDPFNDSRAKKLLQVFKGV